MRCCVDIYTRANLKNWSWLDDNTILLLVIITHTIHHHYIAPTLTHWILQSQSHIAIDGQSVSKSWCRAPPGAHDQMFITLWQLRSCFCGTPSLTRGWFCLLYMLLALASAVFLGSESLGTRDHILLFHIWDFPFRRLHDSQGHGGGIWPRHHTGLWILRESELLYDWRFTANQVILAPSPLRLTARNLFFHLNTCSHSPYVTTSSLTRGWACRLQSPLVLASEFILRSESRRTHDHILLSQIQDSPNLEPRSPYLYPPATGWPNYTSRHWIPFPSPLTTRRTTVEVIRTLLRTLEVQSANPWRINSRWTEYKT
jgi:hypothetical protein